MKSRTWLVQVLVASVLPLQAQQALTLSEALSKVERTSFQAETARAERAEAQEDSAQIKSLYLPEVQLQGGHLNLDHEPALKFGPVAIGPLAVGPFMVGPLNLGPLNTPMADQTSWRYKLSVQYLIYDFGKRGQALSASRSKEDAIGFKNRAEVRRAQVEAATRYLALLNVQAQKKVVSQRRKALEDHLRIVKDLYQQGIVARNDLLRTEVALRSVEDADRSLDNARTSALEGLNVAMGLPPRMDQILPEALPAPPALPWNESDCRLKSQEANEGVKALKAKVKALDEQVTYRKRDYAPNLVAEAAHTYEQNSFSVYPHQNSLYLGLSWKIFDGARAARVRRAESERDLGKREILEGERKAENVAASAYRSFQVALQEAETAQANVKAAEENLRIVEDQYKEGLARTTDALDAESILAESRFALAEKHYRAYAQQAVLLAALGEDLPAFYQSINASAASLEK